MLTVTAVDVENGAITPSNAVPREPFMLDMDGLALQSGSINAHQWQREYLGEWANDEIRAMPENTTWPLAYASHNASSSVSAPRVESDTLWQSRLNQAEEAMARLADVQATPRLWQVEQESDEFAVRLRSYPNYVTYNPARPIAGTFVVDSEPRPAALSPVPPPFDDGWIRQNAGYGDSWEPCRNNCHICRQDRDIARKKYDAKYSPPQVSVGRWWDLTKLLWHNLAVAHTAAVFMLEAHWSDGERKFTNESQIRSYV